MILGTKSLIIVLIIALIIILIVALIVALVVVLVVVVSVTGQKKYSIHLPDMCRMLYQMLEVL